MKRAFVTHRSVVRMAARLTFLGAATALAYGGVMFTRHHLTRVSLEQRAQVVEGAIAQGRISDAEAAYQALHEAHALTPERERVLSAHLHVAQQHHQQKEESKGIESALQQYDVPKATAALSVLSQSGRYADAQLAGYREQIAALQDEGKVYQILVAKSPAERKNLASYYLAQFQTGSHLHEVTTLLFIDRIDELSQLLRQQQSFGEILPPLEELMVLAEQYRNSGVTLPAVYSAKQLTERITAYSAIGQPVTTETPKGTSLRVKLADPSVNVNWHSDYRAERDATIPIGSIGKNIGYLEDTNHRRQWLVQFDGIGTGAWKSRWNDVSQYWKDNHNNVAGYRQEELEVVGYDSPAQQFVAEQAFGKLQSALQPYFANVPEVPKPSEPPKNPEVPKTTESSKDTLTATTAVEHIH